MRLSCGGEAKRHGPRDYGPLRTASRMTATGAGTPVQSSKDFAPWRTSASSPSITSQPAARAAATSAVSAPSGEYASSTTVCPATRLDEQLVAYRGRVHDQVAAGRIRRPVAAAGEDARVRREAPGDERLRGAAGADQAGARRVDRRRGSPSVLMPMHAAVAEDAACSPRRRRPRRTRRRRRPCAGSSRSRRRSRASRERRTAATGSSTSNAV